MVSNLYETKDLVVKETSLVYVDLPPNCLYTIKQLFELNFPADLKPV